jgi:hypothetical protein
MRRWQPPVPLPLLHGEARRARALQPGPGPSPLRSRWPASKRAGPRRRPAPPPQDGCKLLLEVKNCVCADYPAGGVPPGRSQVGVYTSGAVPYQRTAIFPHGAKKKAMVDGHKVDVVSDRWGGSVRWGGGGKEAAGLCQLWCWCE